MTASGEPARVTLAHIAALAQVSMSTVSKVLNGRPDVASATRARVQNLLVDFGYAPRGGHQANAVVELVFHDLDSLWAIEIIRGVQGVARDNGLSVVLTESGSGRSPAPDWVNGTLGRHPRGVVLVFSDLPGEQRAALSARGIPFAVVDPSGDPSPGVPSVGSANWAGGLAATRHLIDLGHRRIGTITGASAVMCSRARVHGYRAALDAAGVEFHPELQRQGDFHVEAGHVEGAKLLRMQDPPTGIFAGSDLQAMGVYQAATELGVAIPADVSVVGYDDIEVARWLGPSLTTVRQPLARMAEEATRMVLKLAAGVALESDRLDLGTELIVRSSTAPPRAGRGGAR